MRRFTFSIAENESQIADAQRLRWVVYGEEEERLRAETCASYRNGRLVDSIDASPCVAHILVYDGAQPVGTVRLTDLAGAGGGAPMAAELAPPFSVEGLPQWAFLGVVERFCVLRRFRGTWVTAALHQGLIAESQRRGISDWLALANAETDCPRDAAHVYRVAEARGLVRADIRTVSIVDACPQTPCTQHVYDSAQRALTTRADLSRVPLPRTLNLFAKRMGGRFVGRPIYDTTFQVFALPLVAKPLELRTARRVGGRILNSRASDIPER